MAPRGPARHHICCRLLGPDPDEDDNPPGLIYLGMAQRGKPTVIVRQVFSADYPDSIREQTALRALELLRQGAE